VWQFMQAALSNEIDDTQRWPSAAARDQHSS